jgi:uncharacterized protein (TIGR02145 family)
MGSNMKVVFFCIVAVTVIAIGSPPYEYIEANRQRGLEIQRIERARVNCRRFGTCTPGLLCCSNMSNSWENVGIFTDLRDGKEYCTVRIGNRTWMAENLNFETDSSWCFRNDENNCQKYGRLYNWGAAMTACPAGWRLPIREDWDDLIQTTGVGHESAGRKLKSRTSWNGTDDYCFSALPGGLRTNGKFGHIGNIGSWWFIDENWNNDILAHIKSMTSSYGVNSNLTHKAIAYSVRCVRN